MQRLQRLRSCQLFRAFQQSSGSSPATGPALSVSTACAKAFNKVPLKLHLLQASTHVRAGAFPATCHTWAKASACVRSSRAAGSWKRHARPAQRDPCAKVPCNALQCPAMPCDARKDGKVPFPGGRHEAAPVPQRHPCAPNLAAQYNPAPKASHAPVPPGPPGNQRRKLAAHHSLRQSSAPAREPKARKGRHRSCPKCFG